MSKTIAILLTVFNRRECTLKCLRQLTEQILQDGVTYDVYITDGGSTDGTVESVQELYPEVNIQVNAVCLVLYSHESSLKALYEFLLTLCE